MKHIIRCPHCGWKTKEHYYVTDCTKETANVPDPEKAPFALKTVFDTTADPLL